MLLEKVSLDTKLVFRLQEHLVEHKGLQGCLEGGIPAKMLPEVRRLMADAKDLARQLSEVPECELCEPLGRARAALIEHWRSLWSNGGISERDYRATLKSAILFLEYLYVARPAEDDTGKGEPRTQCEDCT